MGYSTRVEGTIKITPPLTWAEIRCSPVRPGRNGRPEDTNKALKLVITVEEVETDDGILNRRTAAELVPAWEDAYKAGGIVGDLQEIVEEFPNHLFTGTLEATGEEGERWELTAGGRTVERHDMLVMHPLAFEALRRAATDGDGEQVRAEAKRLLAAVDAMAKKAEQRAGRLGVY